MKKILIISSFLAVFFTMACNSTKNSIATATPPPPAQTSKEPQKGELIESEMKLPTPQYEKKALPQKNNRPQAFETAELVPDTIKH